MIKKHSVNLSIGIYQRTISVRLKILFTYIINFVENLFEYSSFFEYQQTESSISLLSGVRIDNLRLILLLDLFLFSSILFLSLILSRFKLFVFISIRLFESASLEESGKAEGMINIYSHFYNILVLYRSKGFQDSEFFNLTNIGF